MYKKITHNIIEEHFDNIAAYQCGGNAKIMMSGNSITAGIFSGGENSPSAVALKSAAKDYFLNYLMGVRNYIISKISGDISATTESRKILDQHVQKFSKLISSFFSLEDTPKIVTAFTNLTNRILDMIDGLAENKNTEASQAELTKEINNFAGLLYSLAPNQWSQWPLINLWASIANSIADQVRSRISKNWEEDSAALDRSAMYLVTNVFPDLGFSEALAKGIIYLRPGRFET
jgi:hypothetical protein